MHAPTWLTASCRAVRAAALDVSSVLKAAACLEARTDGCGDGAAGGDGERERPAGEDAAGEDMAGLSGADRFDRATPEAAATVTTTTAAAARMGLRARGRCADSSGSGPTGSSVASGSSGPGPAAGRLSAAIGRSSAAIGRSSAAIGSRRSGGNSGRARRRRPARIRWLVRCGPASATGAGQPAHRAGGPAPPAVPRRTGRSSGNGRPGSSRARWPALGPLPPGNSGRLAVALGGSA